MSVQQVFSDHRARPPTGHTNLVRSPCMGPNPYSGSESWGVGGMGRKVEKSIFAISLSFGPPGLTDSPVTSYAAPRLLSHPLTVQNHSRPLHTHGSAPCKVDVGWDFSKKNEKMEISKKMKNFEREMKFTSIFFVSAGQKSEKKQKSENMKKTQKHKKLKKTKNVQIILMNTLWKKRLKSPPALRGRF